MEEKKEIQFKVSQEDKNTIFENTDKKIWLYSNIFIIFMILLSIILAFVSTIPEIINNFFNYLFLIDLFISILFWLEYFYRLKHSKNKKKFLLNIFNIFDLLSFLPFFILILIKWIHIIPLFVIFRIFRIFRILELFERIPIAVRLFRWIQKHKTELIIWTFSIFITLIISTTLLYIAEVTWWNREVFSSLPKTMWWWIYALTTSGDAWMIPITNIWRIISGILMILWPILISILWSVIILIFLDSTSMIELKKKKKKKIKCNKCGFKNSKKAKFCNECWNEIKK